MKIIKPTGGRHIRIRAASFLLCILCLMSSFISCIRTTNRDKQADVPSAKKLLYGVMQSGGFSSPELIFGYGESDYTERFGALYHTELDDVADGAFAISSGMSADEITIIRPKAGKAEDFVKILEDHVTEEISVFEKYSPTDTANLKNKLLFREGEFVVLIISADKDAIRDLVISYINNPDSLPELPQTDKNTDVPTETNEPAESTPPVTDAPTTPPETETESQPVTEEPPVTDTPPTPPVTSDFVFAYDNEVGEREETTSELFDDAVFIGDSRLEGVIFYNNLKVGHDFTHTSLSVNKVFTSNIIEMGEDKVTISEALKNIEFKKVYLMFGVNELGWPSVKTFYNDYRKLINYIKEVNPDCTIYIMAMFPTTETYSTNHDNANKKIKDRNDGLAEIADELGIYLINTPEAVCEDEFVLPSGLSNDGVHGNRTANRQILHYLLTHY